MGIYDAFPGQWRGILNQDNSLLGTINRGRAAREGGRAMTPVPYSQGFAGPVPQANVRPYDYNTRGMPRIGPGTGNDYGPGPDYLRAPSSSWGGGDANIPTLKLDPYNLDRVESLTQRAAAPGVRRLRNEMQNVQQGTYENPNVKSMTMRQALQGYGQGLEGIMGGAYKEGRAQYGEERGIADTEAKSNWEAKLRASLMRYQRELYPPRNSNRGHGSGFSTY